MTPRYLTASAVARSLGIGPRRLRTLLAAGRIAGAYRMTHPDADTVYSSPWLIPADFTVSPGKRGPLPIYLRRWSKP